MKIRLFSFLCCAVVLEEVVLFTQAARLLCPNITIKNGKVRRLRRRARFATFACNVGFALAGEKHSTCYHGRWDPPPPKCIRPSCAKMVSPPKNGFIYPSHSGAGLHFFCKAEYKLRGPQHVYCDGVKWDDNAPICLPIKEEPKLSCDFESDDICGWTHDLNHDFDWTKENYNTPSGQIGTGPSWDHTKGENEDGYYMYIESSSRNENDTARLISPIYDRPTGEICFQFYYHMFGKTTGTLRAYLKKTSDSWSLDPQSAFFSLTGNQGNHWYGFTKWLGVVNDDFQIVIEGVRGPGYVSDIAIDDVKIIKNCSKDDEWDDRYTTTDDIVSTTEVLAVVDSCKDRCGTKDLLTHDATRITCDCDDDCYDFNRCCPDFFDFCAAETASTEFPTTTMGNDIDQHEVTKRIVTGPRIQSTTLTAWTTYAPTIKTTKKVTSPTTTMVPTTKTTTSTRPPFTSGTTRKIPPSTNTTPGKPIIIIRTAPTTSKMVFITPSTTPTTSRPTPRKTMKPGKEIENDVIELPVPKDNDEGLFILTTARSDDYLSKEYWSEEDVSSEKEFMRHINDSVPLSSIKTVETGNSNIFIIIIAATGLLVLISVIAFTLIRRWRDPRRRMNFGSSNGTSQSDVRFLTHDEMIDFTLPKNYDQL